MATHSSILAWRTPWTEEPGGLQSMGSQSQTRLRDRAHTHTLISHRAYVLGNTGLVYWLIFNLPTCIRCSVHHCPFSIYAEWRLRNLTTTYKVDSLYPQPAWYSASPPTSRADSSRGCSWKSIEACHWCLNFVHPPTKALWPAQWLDFYGLFRIVPFVSGRLQVIGYCNFPLWFYTIEQSFNDQFNSVAQSCPTLCDPMNRSTPGLPVHHHLPEFTQTHVHRVRDTIQPSHPLSSPSPPAPNPSQHQSLFQWVNSSHEVAKVLEFQL